jgi:hypothetical protein
MANTEQLTQLRQLLTTHFSVSEIHTFCFDLGVDYEDLPGAGKTDKARELIAHMQRRGRLGELVQAGRQSRPDVQWPDLDAAPTSQPPPSPPAASPALRAIKRKALEKRLADLGAEHEAASGQLGYALSAVDRLRIQRQVEALEAEIGQVDAELRTLG